MGDACVIICIALVAYAVPRLGTAFGYYTRITSASTTVNICLIIAFVTIKTTWAQRLTDFAE
jgi:hypothetical protein